MLQNVGFNIKKKLVLNLPWKSFDARRQALFCAVKKCYMAVVHEVAIRVFFFNVASYTNGNGLWNYGLEYRRWYAREFKRLEFMFLHLRYCNSRNFKYVYTYKRHRTTWKTAKQKMCNYFSESWNRALRLRYLVACSTTNFICLSTRSCTSYRARSEKFSSPQRRKEIYSTSVYRFSILSYFHLFLRVSVIHLPRELREASSSTARLLLWIVRWYMLSPRNTYPCNLGRLLCLSLR